MPPERRNENIDVSKYLIFSIGDSIHNRDNQIVGSNPQPVDFTHCIFFCDTPATHIINTSSRSNGTSVELVFVNNAIFQVFNFVNRVTQTEEKQ